MGRRDVGRRQRFVGVIPETGDFIFMFFICIREFINVSVGDAGVGVEKADDRCNY